MATSGSAEMAPPDPIGLTRSDAQDILAALEDAIAPLQGSPLIGLVLALEDAHTLLLDKLYPNGRS